MMKKVLSLILVMVLAFGMLPASYADATDDALVKITASLKAFSGPEKDAFIETMDTYFSLSETEKKGFMASYGSVLDAMSYGENLSEYGLTKDVFETMSGFQSKNGSSAVYNAFKNDGDIETAIKNSKVGFQQVMSADQLSKFSEALDKINKKLKLFTELKGNDILKVVFYSPQDDKMYGPVDENIKMVVTGSNIFKNMSVKSSDLSSAMQKISDYYNGLSGDNKKSVLNLLQNQTVLYTKLNSLNGTKTNVSGKTQSNAAVRVFDANNNELGSTVSDASGSFDIAVNINQTSTLTVKVVRGDVVIDTDTVNVTVNNQSSTSNSGSTGGNTSPSGAKAVNIDSGKKATPTPADDVAINDNATPLGAVNFIDIQNDEWTWAKDAVNTLASAGVITGRSDTIYDPKANITRAEFCALMVRLFDLKINSDNAVSFDDVEENSWYKEVVAIGASNGLMKGYGDSTFKPLNNISREEMVTVIGRILADNNFAVAKANGLEKFSDKQQIESWAAEYAELVVQEGIIKGRSEDMFAPDGLANRAETAVMLFRLSGKVPTVLDAKSE